MSGRELQQEQNRLGLTPESVCNEAGISMSTLYKVYAGERVRGSSELKVRGAIARLRARQAADEKTATG